MFSFAVADQTPSDFVQKVVAEVRQREMQDMVEVGREGDGLTVKVTYMGTSILRFLLSEADGGFRAESGDHSISPMHGPFMSQIEDRVRGVLERVGAKVL